ncbi:MAG: radical SAM protein [Sandaracinaceae bacterium]|nr:radical SAM protein [Sandaracinaceae bacterium]
MEPERQIEIQLGHMCNNRCVFCVSGQRTAMGEARPLDVSPILERLREARASGHRKVTLLGGEPTLQPGFLDVVRECVGLGFEEIVVFTNGVKTARAAVVDEVLATGGRFTWRISIQGATEESHERTTRKPGSFDRILRTLEHLRDRSQPITVNLCVVQSNYEDVDRFPELLDRFGATQLHLDMMRPLDAGVRTDQELRATLPRYSDLAGPFRRMVAGFAPGFDVNIGNLPFCIAPDLAPWIHHDGEPTETVAIDEDDRVSRPWNKYLVKRRDKIKPERCRSCVHDARCSGVFETYARFYGVGELVPVDARSARHHDPQGMLRAVWLRPLLAESGLEAVATSEQSVRVDYAGLVLSLEGRSDREDAAYEGIGVRVLAPSAVETLREVARRLAPLGPIHPLAEDGLGGLAPPLAHAMRRLRRAAPFGTLRWDATEIANSRVEIHLRDPDGTRARAWLALDAGKPRCGYETAAATPALVEGLRALFAALRPSAPAHPYAPPIPAE